MACAISVRMMMRSGTSRRIAGGGSTQPPILLLIVYPLVNTRAASEQHTERRWSWGDKQRT
eukprot:scaffold65755_cov61-Phaeocystis_antarctica.AAC.1